MPRGRSRPGEEFQDQYNGSGWLVPGVSGDGAGAFSGGNARSRESRTPQWVHRPKVSLGHRT
jgi:hypothetical protein